MDQFQNLFHQDKLVFKFSFPEIFRNILLRQQRIYAQSSYPCHLTILLQDCQQEGTTRCVPFTWTTRTKHQNKPPFFIKLPNFTKLLHFSNTKHTDTEILGEKSWALTPLNFFLFAQVSCFLEMDRQFFHFLPVLIVRFIIK